jgi:hypothetical protein
LKDLPEQVLVGLYPKEGHADDDKAHQLRHRIGRKVLQLDPILSKEAMEEI